MKIKYVLGIVLDLNSGFVVGITKKTGPFPMLLNRLTFPGGKAELGESTIAAMTREMMEETGVFVAEGDWVVIDEQETPGYVLTKLVALSSSVLTARTRELEPVWHLAIKRHLKYAELNPEKYAPDFLPTLELALSTVATESICV